jgi:hypothetical protein
MFYPDQPASQFLKKFSRNSYNHAHYLAEKQNGQQSEDSSLALQVSPRRGRSYSIGEKFLRTTTLDREKVKKKKSFLRVKINISA